MIKIRKIFLKNFIAKRKKRVLDYIRYETVTIEIKMNVENMNATLKKVCIA